METSLKEFLHGEKRYYVCPITGFDDLNDPDEKTENKSSLLAGIVFTPILAGDMGKELLDLYRKLKFNLYSPEETVKRARSCIGQGGYNLITNNCEHFAIWCKTGLHESKQIEAWCKEIKNMAKSVFVN